MKKAINISTTIVILLLTTPSHSTENNSEIFLRYYLTTIDQENNKIVYQIETFLTKILLKIIFNDEYSTFCFNYDIVKSKNLVLRTIEENYEKQNTVEVQLSEKKFSVKKTISFVDDLNKNICIQQDQEKLQILKNEIYNKKFVVNFELKKKERDEKTMIQIKPKD